MATTYVSGYLLNPAIATWTDLIVAPANKVLVVREFIVANYHSVSGVLNMRITDSGSTELVKLMGGEVMSSGETYERSQQFIMIQDGEKFQINTDIANMSFAAWGAYE